MKWAKLIIVIMPIAIITAFLSSTIISERRGDWYIYNMDIMVTNTTTPFQTKNCGNLIVDMDLLGFNITKTTYGSCIGRNKDVITWDYIKFTETACWEQRSSGVSKETAKRACDYCYSISSYASASILMIVACGFGMIMYSQVVGKITCGRRVNRNIPEILLYRITTIAVITTLLVVLSMAISSVSGYSRCILMLIMNISTRPQYEPGTDVIQYMKGITPMISQNASWFFAIISMYVFFTTTMIMIASYIPQKSSSILEQEPLTQELL